MLAFRLLPVAVLTFLLSACGAPWITKASLTQVVQGSTATNRGFLTVTFGKASEKPMLLSASIDWNGNGIYESTEEVVKNAPVSPAKNWNGNLPIEFQRTDNLEGLKARLTLSDGGMVEMPLSLVKYDVGDLIDLSTVTNPEESMKGDTVVRPPKPPKQEGVPTNFQSDTPDITQRKDECAPVSAANSFIALAGNHGHIDAIPRDPTELVDLFKKQMGWTAQNGVLIGDFSPGKDFVAKQLGLPIHSETLTSSDFNRIIDRLEETLNGEGAAEMRIQSKVTDANGKVHNVGGHMVTVTRVIRTGQQVSIQIHDPLSPAGTETYEIDPNDGALIHYPFLGGKESEAVRISIAAGFFQTWSEDHSIMDDLGPTGRAKIKVIVVDGHKIPLSEVFVAEPGQCPADHYHASRNGASKALDGAMVPDKAPQHCGFGKVEEVPVEDCTPDGADCSPVKFEKKK